MNHRLLAHRPRVEAFEGSQVMSSLTADETELEQADTLLEQAGNGHLATYLATLGQQNLKRTEPRLKSEVLYWLDQTARHLLPPGRIETAGAGETLHLELAGLSPENRSFEIARHFSRFASEVLQRTANLPPGRAPPDLTAVRIIRQTARRHLPGLLPLLSRTNPGQAASPPINPLSSIRGTHPFQGIPTATSKESVMHDIDRTQMEYGAQPARFSHEQFEFQENEWSPGTSAVLSEADEYELAMELLGVASEAELDQFLGGLIKKVGSGIRQFAGSDLGKAVGGVLKGVAKKALPIAGDVLGGAIGGPIGAQIGRGLAQAATNHFESEALSQEEQEFEGAKQFVRLAADTVSKALAAPATADPRAVAQSAAITAARQLAPGLLKAATGSATATAAPPMRGQSGRWARQGNKIVLYGA